MNIYKENLQFLKMNAIDIYNTLTDCDSVFEYKASYIPEEDNFLVEKKGIQCFLNSRINTENEARMMFHNMPLDTEIVVLFGVGSGSAVDYLLKKPNKVRYLIIIEPMVEVFKLFMSRYRFCDMGSIGKFTCVLNSKGSAAYNIIRNALVGELESKLYFAFHVSYRTIFREYYDDIQFNVLRLIRSSRYSLITNYVNFKLKSLSYISNLKVDCLPVESLKELFYGRPAIIVSAGPSLNKNMHLLNSVKDRAIIIAAGSAIKILDKYGIKPHFRIAYDWTKEQKDIIFDELTDKSIPLIFADQLFCKILPDYDGKKFRLNITDGVIPIQVLKGAGIEFETYFTAVSIANVTLGMLCKMGCTQVILMGQDMCYEDNKLYADGREQKSLNDPKQLMQVRNIYGHMVFTEYKYLQIKYDFEALIPLYPHIKYINATEGGVGIDGTINMDMSEVIEKVLDKPLNISIDDYVNNIYNVETERNYNKKIVKGVRKLKECNEQLLRTCMGIIDEYREIEVEENDEDCKDRRYACIEERAGCLEENEYYKNTVSIILKSILEVLSCKNGSQELAINNGLSDKTKVKISSVTEYCLFIEKCIKEVFKDEIQ